MSIENNQISFMDVQFFKLSYIKPDQESQCPHNQEETLMEVDNLMEQQIFIEPESSKDSEQTSKFSKTKSVLHNFQKHLFTFIQSLIPKEGKLLEVNQSLNEKCVKHILRLLKGEKKKTREELVPIFGELNITRINRSCQIYRSLIDQFSQEIFRQSLLKVRNILMQKIKGDSIKQYVEKSKMEKKVEFIKYMESFINEVYDGRFGCRLSKKSQTQIRQKINEEIKYNQWKSLVL